MQHQHLSSKLYSITYGLKFLLIECLQYQGYHGASVDQALDFHTRQLCCRSMYVFHQLSLEGVSHCRSPPPPGSQRWSLLGSQHLLGWSFVPLSVGWWGLRTVVDKVAILSTPLAGGSSWSGYQGGQQLVKSALLQPEHLPLLFYMHCQRLLLFLTLFYQNFCPEIRSATTFCFCWPPTLLHSTISSSTAVPLAAADLLRSSSWYQCTSRELEKWQQNDPFASV